ncbi:MAG: DUF4097 family beta strand repeat-containing protein [Psychroflexus sp.]|jgi:hypothetical protein|nr:DUF4097 family beta strand repeat-containing protein [Psychroflexus sp.]MDR9447939.1 DUF4097 family beta strand repeat-containing protein [Psychroflexus sp.]
MMLSTRAQVKTTQQIDAASIQKITLDLDQVAFVDIRATPTNKIEMETVSNGEYSQAISFDKQIDKEELRIRSVFDGKLKGGFDKLSAHKVFSIGLALSIPAEIEVDISTDISNISIKGNFQSVHIENKFGDCELIDFRGNANINTFDGHVFITTRDAKVEARTSTGDKNVHRFKREKYLIKVRTVDGNIKIQPKKE